MQFDVHTHCDDKGLKALFNCEIKTSTQTYFSSGIHPWKSDRWDSNLQNIIIENVQRKNCLAIGEIGLDKVKGPELSIQIKCLKEQLQIAIKYRKPVIFHCVRSWQELNEIVSESGIKEPLIWHGFNKAKLLKEVLQRGYFISLGKDLLSNESLQEEIKNTPLDRIFLETDDSNIPLNDLYLKLAELKNITLPELEIAIENNISKIFPSWIIG